METTKAIKQTKEQYVGMLKGCLPDIPYVNNVDVKEDAVRFVVTVTIESTDFLPMLKDYLKRIAPVDFSGVDLRAIVFNVRSLELRRIIAFDILNSRNTSLNEWFRYALKYLSQYRDLKSEYIRISDNSAVIHVRPDYEEEYDFARKVILELIERMSEVEFYEKVDVTCIVSVPRTTKELKVSVSYE